MPTRINQDLFDAARTAGELHSRSAAQQLDHWLDSAWVLEASPALTHHAVERVLSGEVPYDALGGPEQALARVAWDEEIAERVSALDFEERLRKTGSAWARQTTTGTSSSVIPPGEYARLGCSGRTERFGQVDVSSPRTVLCFRSRTCRSSTPIISAAERWPGGEESDHAYDAAQVAAADLAGRGDRGPCLVHHRDGVQPSQQGRAGSSGRSAPATSVELHVMLVPEELAVRRVAYRVKLTAGTRSLSKVREPHHRRLWALVGRAQRRAHRKTFYDNTRSKPFRRVAVYQRGRPATAPPQWPAWTPPELMAAL